MRHLIAMMQTRSIRKSAEVRACGPRGGFCKGFVPWAHDRSIASPPRGGMKSLDLNEIIEFIWFSFDFSKSVRAGILPGFFETPFGV